MKILPAFNAASPLLFSFSFKYSSFFILTLKFNFKSSSLLFLSSMNNILKKFWVIFAIKVKKTFCNRRFDSEQSISLSSSNKLKKESFVFLSLNLGLLIFTALLSKSPFKFPIASKSWNPSL